MSAAKCLSRRLGSCPSKSSSGLLLLCTSCCLSRVEARHVAWHCQCTSGGRWRAAGCNCQRQISRPSLRVYTISQSRSTAEAELANTRLQQGAQSARTVLQGCRHLAPGFRSRLVPAFFPVMPLVRRWPCLCPQQAASVITRSTKASITRELDQAAAP